MATGLQPRWPSRAVTDDSPQILKDARLAYAKAFTAGLPKPGLKTLP